MDYIEDDFILKLVRKGGGMKPQNNGAYREEMKVLRYPYYSNNGLTVDVMVEHINNECHIRMTESELIEYVITNLKNKRLNKSLLRDK